MKNFGIKQIGFHQTGTVKGGLQPQLYSGSWGNRGKGNEIQSALEKGLSWIGDKYVNAEDYFEDTFNYLVTTPLAILTGKTKEVPRVIKEMKEARNDPRIHGAVVPFDLISPIKGGWMLKGLMRGSQLEKQLSKAGTININGLLAYLNKASKLELDVIGKILKEQFAGLKNIDYNALRKAISDELIRYSRVPQDAYAAYGMDRLGFNVETDPVIGSRYDYVPGINTKTYTFESPRIPHGDGLHYDSTTLGHSRTYTTPEESDILHVMESLSDWAQNLNLKGYLDFEPVPDFPFNDLLENTRITELQKHLAKNYLLRQLQENMKYAAEQGYKKMRYPTRETAAKIEGFEPIYNSEAYSIESALHTLRNNTYNLFDEDDPFPDMILSSDEASREIERLEKLLEEVKSGPAKYPDKHEAILKKYSDFPKIFNKLFKGLEVRTVTDSKGNTWYEVDIPENFLESEWLFKEGGILGLNKIIGL